ncbi:MAG: hypothetical protein E7442_04060 [Ruminococcaceae bacterium]|nr:hypothetical protein [Oscillospiraceae bacterium]
MSKLAITLQQLEEALRDMTRWMQDKLRSYIVEPAAEGKSGYILKTNGAGGRSWEAPGEFEYWRPTVSAEGELSWMRSGDTEEPGSINICGPQGPAGPTGPAPVKGVDYWLEEERAALAEEAAAFVPRWTETYRGTFSASGWSSSAPYTQTITVTGVLLTDYPFVDIDLSNATDASAVIEDWKLVGRCTVSANNKVIAYCYENKPTANIPVVFKVVR